MQELRCRPPALVPAASAYAQASTHLHDLCAEGVDALGQTQHLTMQGLQLPCLHLSHVSIKPSSYSPSLSVLCASFVSCS